jgi:hypothetical protein
MSKKNVEGMFGTIELTRENYVRRWSDQVRELKRLDYSQAWLDYVQGVTMAVEIKAGLEWDALPEK